MKIAITALKNNLESLLDPRFGRAKFICIYDTEKKEEKFIDNGQNLNVAHGAGTQAASTVLEHNVEVLITGSVGPKAFDVLKDVNIRMFEGKPEHTVMENIIMFKDNALNEITSAGETQHGGH
jgi:predicted Fe-Mo cluster-binding NifX family protein